ncbi:hypothetical protein Mgra_00003068 [Meloidogyne graminicola]|uniref:Uncharacterized protein n=1 Tax=Meloidogyne graminicola TaxID=189291 RepID=A0A8S9ZWA6_9BILA|nr:hypothetical protein Mgra_00003068 [Meloidogyne graminicola]
MKKMSCKSPQINKKNNNNEQEEEKIQNQFYDEELKAIMQNLYIIDARTDRTDAELLKLFSNRILNDLVKICQYKESAICTKIKAINNYIEGVMLKYNKPNIDTSYYLEMKHISQEIRIPFYKTHPICDNLNEIEYEEIVNKMGKFVKHESGGDLFKLRHKQYNNIQQYIKSNIEKGIKLKNKLKMATTISLDGYQYVYSKNFVKNIKNQLTKLACECTIGVNDICSNGYPVNCYSIKSALGIFVIELFAYSVKEDYFDEFIGKWPSTIYFYN